MGRHEPPIFSKYFLWPASEPEASEIPSQKSLSLRKWFWYLYGGVKVLLAAGHRQSRRVSSGDGDAMRSQDNPRNLEDSTFCSGSAPDAGWAPFSGTLLFN